MLLKRLPTGMLGANCYIVGDNGEGIVIDPGTEGDEIIEAVEKTDLKIKYIILTHAHIDHIYSMDEVRKKTGALVAIHEEDAPLLSDSRANGAMLFGLNNVFSNADILLKDGDVLNAGGLSFKIIHTPGHTPGGICIMVEDCIFTGDTLFKMSVGRTDLGKGDYDLLQDSLKNKLMQLDGNVKVYPGHGTSTTIYYERQYNPFI